MFGYVFIELQEGGTYTREAGILVAEKCVKSIIGSELLSLQIFTESQVSGCESDVSVIEKEEELNEDKRLYETKMREFPNSLPESRKSETLNQKYKILMKQIQRFKNGRKSQFKRKKRLSKKKEKTSI